MVERDKDPVMQTGNRNHNLAVGKQLHIRPENHDEREYGPGHPPVGRITEPEFSSEVVSRSGTGLGRIGFHVERGRCAYHTGG
jgi:hypothetical protein